MRVDASVAMDYRTLVGGFASGLCLGHLSSFIIHISTTGWRKYAKQWPKIKLIISITFILNGLNGGCYNMGFNASMTSNYLLYST